jgi:hypothetical protein
MYQMNPINFTPLQAPPTAADLALAGETGLFRGLHSRWMYLFLIPYTLAVLILGESARELYRGSLGDIAPIIAIMSALILLPAALYWYIHTSLQSRARLIAFAAANQMTIGFDAGAPAYDGIIFTQGNSRARPVVLGYDQGASPFEIGNYQYETGSGKTRTVHRTGYVRIRLPRRLPNMVLDATSNNLFGKISNLPTGFYANQRLSLEGNFDKYFTLYAPSQYKTDALYVFTPDVMATMIEYGKDFDMEIIDDSLFLYSVNMFRLDRPEELSKLFTVISVIQHEVSSQTDYYRDERAYNAQVANVVAPAGARLRRRPAYAVGITFIVLMAVQFLPPSIAGFPVALIVAVIILAAIIWARVARLRP